MRRLVLLMFLLPLLALGVATVAASELDSIFGQLEKLEQAHSGIKKRIQEIDKRRDELKAQLKSSEADIARAREQADERSRLLSRRLREIYKIRSVSGWEYQLASRDFSDFVLRRRYMAMLAERDRKVLESYQAAVETIASRKRKLQDDRAELDKLVAELQEKQNSLSGKLAERRAFVDKVRRDAALKAKAERERLAAGQKLDRRVARLDGEASPPERPFAELKGKLRCPASGVIEMGFGESVVGDAQTFHGGYDIRAKAGARIVAPAAGRVVFAGNFRGFGNLLVIDHGDKYHTLYAHLRELLKPKGESVRSGELIGHVGESGSLKGAYLYFELRHKGKPVNPDAWLRCR